MLQLSPCVAVCAAARRPQAQPAVVPQLSLRTETMRCLNKSDQKGDTDRAQPGNLFEELTGRMLPAFRQQLLPRFLPYLRQKIELLIDPLSPATHTDFPQFFQPGGAMARGIEGVMQTIKITADSTGAVRDLLELSALADSTKLSPEIIDRL